MRMHVESLASLSGLRIQCCCELWCRPAATAPNGPLGWEPPYATGVALKTKQNKTKQTKKKLFLTFAVDLMVLETVTWSPITNMDSECVLSF